MAGVASNIAVLALLVIACGVWQGKLDAAAAAVVGRGEPTVAWALETFIELSRPGSGPDSKPRMDRVELRHACCQSVEKTSLAFCSEFAIPADGCARLEAFLVEELQARDGGECSAHSCREGLHPLPTKKIGAMAIYLNNPNTGDSQRVELAIHQGDLTAIEGRAHRLCLLLNLHGDTCTDLRLPLTEKVIELEITTARNDIQHATSEQSLQDGLDAYDDVVNHLRRENRALRDVVQEKAAAYGKLYWASLGASQEQDRKLRRLKRDQEHSPPDNHIPGHKKRADTSIVTADLSEDGRVTASHLPAHHRNSTQRWVSSQDIPRIPAASCSYAQYLSYARSSTPIIFTGFSDIKRSPGVPQWSLESLNRDCGQSNATLKTSASATNRSSGSSSSFQASNEPGRRMWAGVHAVAETPLRNFLRDLQDPRVEPWPKSYANLYLHDVSLAQFCPRLLDDFHVPRFFTRDRMQLFESMQRDYWPSLFVGGASTASALHADWGATSAWMGLLQGRKHCIISKPSSRAVLNEELPTAASPTEGRFASNLMDDNDCEEGADSAQQCVMRSRNEPMWGLLQADEVFEGVLEAGEVLFIPAECPHQVRNLELTIAVAMNFVDDGNVDRFTAFLEREMHSSSSDQHASFAEKLRLLRDADTKLSSHASTEDVPFHVFKAQQWS